MNGVRPNELVEIEKIIRETVPDCTVIAFGSRHKGTYKTHSDLDLAFIQKDGGRLGLRKKGDLKDLFMESGLPYRVDIIDYNGCSPEFKAIIDADYAIIYNALNSE